MRAAAILVALTGCGTLLGIDDFGPAGPGTGQTAADGAVSTTSMVAGHLFIDDGSFPLPALANTIVALHVDNGSTLHDGPTDTSGHYELDLFPTEPATFVAAASQAGIYAPHRYLDHEAQNFANFDLEAFSSARLDQFASVASATQSTASGVVIVDVVDASGSPLMGATITTHGVGQLRYHDNATNSPGPTGTVTDSFGEAWAFGVPPGSIAVQASLGTSLSVDRTILVDASTIVNIQLLVP